MCTTPIPGLDLQGIAKASHHQPVIKNHVEYWPQEHLEATCIIICLRLRHLHQCSLLIGKLGSVFSGWQGASSHRHKAVTSGWHRCFSRISCVFRLTLDSLGSVSLVLPISLSLSLSLWSCSKLRSQAMEELSEWRSWFSNNNRRVGSIHTTGPVEELLC